jgi:hypothetical protein
MRDIKYRGDGRPEDLLQELGYETQDIAYKRFSVYAAYFFGFFIVCGILGFVFMYFMSPTKLRGGRMADYVPKTTMPVAAPLLQSDITARTDIMSLRRKETEALTTSAVIDQQHGVYRIPVDNAIDDVVKMSDADRAKMGLPPTASDQTSHPIPVSATTPSNFTGGESATAKPKGGNGG